MYAVERIGFTPRSGWLEPRLALGLTATADDRCLIQELHRIVRSNVQP